MTQANFQTKLFINNEFVDALDGATFDVFNPFDNSVVKALLFHGIGHGEAAD